MENKHEAMKALTEFLHHTRGGKAVEKIIYVDSALPDHPTWHDEHVVIYWTRENKKPTTIRVTGDSELQMAATIINNIM